MAHHPSCGCRGCSMRGISSAGKRRSQNYGKSSYGRDSGSGTYGRGSYSFQEATFDGYPALKRSRDGKTEFFYGPAPVDINDASHGHAIIKNGKLIYKRRPGESKPVVDLGG